MKKIIICFFLVLLFFGCSKKEEGKVLATIDDEKITLSEFGKELDKIPMNMKMMVATQSGKKSYLDNLIVKKLLLREARKDKIDTEKEFQDRLADIKDQLLIESVLKKKVNAASQLSDEELKKYYDSHKEEFKKQVEINTRHILLKSEDEAKQVQGRIAKGEDFIELAKKFSIDPNAKVTGGEIGFHPKGTLLPEYEAAAFKLTKPGQVSGVVKSQLGYHIIRLEGSKPAAYVPFEEVKDFIKQKIAQEKQKELLEKYVESLKKSAKITINEDLLKDEKPQEKAPAESKPEATGKPEASGKPEGTASQEAGSKAPPKAEKAEAGQPKK
jgi:peptidyl-prolyl cis-trans isomerase C